jgi:hypothetical protein
MAKKKAAKPKALRLRQIVDDEDSWSEIPVSVCAQCGISLKGPRRDDFCYVRGEDAGWLADAAIQRHGFALRWKQYWVPGFRAWLKGDQWPKAKAWPGGKWPKGSIWRGDK